MSKLSQDQLELLVTKATTDSAFRELLKSAPQEAVKSLVELDPEDLAVLKTLSADLDRFATIPLGPIDADSWAVGICHIRSHPPGAKR